jgi:hypothetical protein
MSAIGGKADMTLTLDNVRSTPKADIHLASTDAAIGGRPLWQAI